MYADLTVNDPNPIKRWLQDARFRDALSLFRQAGGGRSRVLDYGGGDGELLFRLLAQSEIEPALFEPTPGLMNEARARLSKHSGIRFFSAADDIPADCFDFVFCLGVFEHLPSEQTHCALARIKRSLDRGGQGVISVPIEVGLPALGKGSFRMARRYGDYDAVFSNVVKSVIGRSPAHRPVAEICPGFPYHFHHLGFDWRKFESVLSEKFVIQRRRFSPLDLFGGWLNSEVLFLVSKTG